MKTLLIRFGSCLNLELFECGYDALELAPDIMTNGSQFVCNV